MKPAIPWTPPNKKWAYYGGRFFLGLAFVVAGIVKIQEPYQFAGAVLAYQLLPQPLAGLAAAIIPWLEVVSGGFLCLGLKRRSCLLVISLFMAVFLGVIAVTLARGLEIDCGCGLFSDRQVGVVALVEDILLLGLAIWLYRVERERAAAG